MKVMNSSLIHSRNPFPKAVQPIMRTVAFFQVSLSKSVSMLGGRGEGEELEP